MSAPTLAELRARSGPRPLPKGTRTVTLIEGQHLLDESQRLNDELVDLLAEHARTDEDGERVGPPPKAGQRKLPAVAQDRLDAIRAQSAALLEQLGEWQGEVGLTGVTGGEWQAWKDDHPPREDSRADHTLTGGRCNSSDLFAALGRYVTSWNGDVLAKDDWDSWLAESITYADRRDLVSAVVDLHETGLSRVPKSPSGSSTTASSETA